MGLVFSPTTFGRSDEPFIIYSCLSLKTSDICPYSLSLTPYASDLKTLFSQKVAKQLAICLVSGLSLFLIYNIETSSKNSNFFLYFFLVSISYMSNFIFFSTNYFIGPIDFFSTGPIRFFLIKHSYKALNLTY